MKNKKIRDGWLMHEAGAQSRPQQPSDIQFSPLQQHNSKVLKGVSDLMRQAQERQQANDSKVLKGVVDINALRQKQEIMLRNARRYGSAGYGMSDNDWGDEYLFLESDKDESPKNYLDIIKSGSEE